MRIVCVATDCESLQALKRAALSASWELSIGATNEGAALDQAADAHVLVVFGPFDGLAAKAKEIRPALRVLSDRDGEGVDAVVGSLDEVPGAIVGQPRPGGPVRV